MIHQFENFEDGAYSFGTWTGQTCSSLWGANSLNVALKEVVNANLYDRQPKNSKDLSAKHRTRRDFHVVAELHIAGVCQSIILHHITVTLEHHHCNRTTW